MREVRSRRIALGMVPLALVLALALAACSDSSRVSRGVSVTFGDAEIGRQLISHYGCGSCHTIPGVANADAKVGPPLNAFGERSFIAGQLANTPDNLVRWIMDPQGVEPGTAMPNLGVSREDAQNIAAYLERLR